MDPSQKPRNIEVSINGRQLTTGEVYGLTQLLHHGLGDNESGATTINPNWKSIAQNFCSTFEQANPEAAKLAA